MLKIHFLLTILFFSITYASAGDDLEIVRERVRAEMLEPPVNEQMIQYLIENLKENGKWPNIDYKDVSRTGFEHSEHLDNMVMLARAYKKPASPFYGDNKIKTTLNASLNFWLKNDFICDNWWWNQIGTPNNLVTVLLIMDDDVTAEQKEKAAPIIGRAHLNASGARPSGDRIKIGGILAKHLLFTHHKKAFDEVIEVIENEIKFSTGERGMQHDYSFHHRVDRVNNTISYGKGYADAFAEWAAYVAGTSYAFSDDKLNHLIDYYLDGICKTLIYAKYPDPGSKNRSITRKGTLHAWDAETPERLASASDYRKDELEHVAAVRKDKEEPAMAHDKFFWQSEHHTHQRPDFFTSVRMYSVRNHNMEQPYNEEGLKNHHLADGSNFISRTGKEYDNIFPAFDWQKIPGTTVVQKPVLPGPEEIQKEGVTTFVGSVTDGMYGAAAFDFVSPHDPVSAKKAWFFFDEEYVCLGAGINSGADLPVATTLNQCLLTSDVFVSENDVITVQNRGEYLLSSADWVFHDSIAYVFPKPAPVYLSCEAQSGSWRSINHQSEYTNETVEKEVFKLWFDHGKKPVDKTYSYIVIPSLDVKQLTKYVKDIPVKIVENNDSLQMVRHKELDQYHAVFYKPGVAKLNNNLQLRMKNPGMVMVKFNGNNLSEIVVSDPSRGLKEINLTINRNVKVTCAYVSTSFDAQTNSSELQIALPQGVYAGKSRIITF